MSKSFYVISGGTSVPVSPHFALSAPAYGRVGVELSALLRAPGLLDQNTRVHHVRTRMALGDREPSELERALFERAGIARLETNDDMGKLLAALKADPDTRCIVLAAAICDWVPAAMHDADGASLAVGPGAPRLQSRGAAPTLSLAPSDKLVGDLRKGRKDIFVVAFKATAGASEREQYAAGLRLLKGASANLVLANDVRERRNMVITPEEFPYPAESREEALSLLAEMIAARTALTFVRTKMRDEAPADPRALHAAGALPDNFVPVLEHLIARGAYKPFRGRTSGHFGCRVLDETLGFRRISSIRKVDHNSVLQAGMAKIYGTEGGHILAGGGRPSVGEHTQQSLYDSLGDAIDSIVHFHCPARPGRPIASAPQRAFECGSVQCADNTAAHMERVAEGIYAVDLEGHGPNIGFHRSVPAERVIAFIDEHFDLSDKTGGLLPEGS